MITATFLVPVGWPIARMANQVRNDELLTRRVEAALRHNVRHCQGSPRREYPALDELRLVEAIEHALSGDGLRKERP